jgi:hypothetical protein
VASPDRLALAAITSQSPFGIAIMVPLFSSMLLSGILNPTTINGAVTLCSGNAAGLSSSVGLAMAGLF